MFVAGIIALLSKVTVIVSKFKKVKRIKVLIIEPEQRKLNNYRILRIWQITKT